MAKEVAKEEVNQKQVKQYVLEKQAELLFFKMDIHSIFPVWFSVL